jgi:hypothetical protein
MHGRESAHGLEDRELELSADFSPNFARLFDANFEFY